ncbi:leukocyte-associated immunoglobulin-like receptor 2 isoform X2 [Myotis yumanensis]|uniref:leukocyte-associated immunoglobulin-like receptor 2 isoform X2 n=1 Tax=Myotis yumanensis TaxID=159337 RepID=UPI0038D3E4A8
MSPRPSTLLGLVLCLVQTIHMQQGVLPIPSLRAEPGPVVPLGEPVTFLCRGPAWADFFHLEKDGRLLYLYHKSEPQDGSQRTEARFHIPAVSKVTAGSYRCLYEHMYEIRSELSEPLQLQVTGEDVSTPTSATRPALTLPPTEVTPSPTEMASGTDRLSFLQVDKDREDGERLAMSPWPSTLLGLVLCLVQTIHMQEGARPKPSLRAEPGPVVPPGRPVTFVCRSPAVANICRLEKDGRRIHGYQDRMLQNGPQETEARFLLPAQQALLSPSHPQK